MKMLKKRITAAMLLFLVLFSTAAVYGLEPYLNYMHYWPNAPQTYLLNSEDCTKQTNATTSGNAIVFAGTGSVTYDLLLPFHCRGVVLRYSGNAGATITLTTGQQTYTIPLSNASGEQQLLFYEYLGYEPTIVPYSTADTKNEYIERAGERSFTLQSTAAVTLSSVEFQKEMIHRSYAESSGLKYPTDYSPVNLSNNEKAIGESVIIDSAASMIMVRGGRRYIDNDNPQELPMVLGGRMYLPIGTLSRALGYYYEDIPEKAYALMRCEPYEFVFQNGVGVLTKNMAAPQELEKNLLVYREGKTYVPVRYFSEILGKTVGFRDGVAVIDSKHRVKRVIESETVFSFVRQKLAEFHPNVMIGNTYYVAQTPNANDNGNDGSAEAPFLTLARATEVAQVGDTVIVHEGTYRETLTPQRDGTATNPIIFRAAEGERVVLSAANRITDSFTPYSGDIYTASTAVDLGNGRNQIYVDGKAMVEARYPNEPAINNPVNGSTELSKLWPVKGDFIADSKHLKVESATLLNQSKDYWKGATYVGFFSWGWNLATAKIESSDTGSLSIAEPDSTAVNGLSWWWWGGDTAVANNFGSWGQIQGHINALDEAEEWVVKDGSLYLMFPEGKNPQNATVEIKARQLVADLSGRKYIQVLGFETLGGSVLMKDSEMCIVKDLDMHYISHYTYGVDQLEGYIDGSVRNTADSNGAPQRGEMGILISGRDNVAIGNSIDHSAAAGFYLTGAYTYLEDNALNDCGYMGSYVGGIFVNMDSFRERGYLAGGHGIYHNTVSNAGRSCFLVSAPSLWYTAEMLPFECAFNDFHDAGLTANDVGIIYAYGMLCGTDSLKSGIHHNYIYNTRANTDVTGCLYGIYNDGLTMGIDTYNNVLFATHENVKFEHDVYPQPQKESTSYHDYWGNTSPMVVPSGAEGLLEEHFPAGKVFYAGVRSKTEKYLANYKRAEKGQSKVVLPAYRAKISSGVLLDELGFAAFTGNGQTVTFPSCDFSAGGNYQVTLLFGGDKYRAGDAVRVSIGNNSTDITADMKAPKLEQNNTKVIPFTVTAGTYDVVIQMNDYRSMKVSGIMIEKTP